MLENKKKNLEKKVKSGNQSETAAAGYPDNPSFTDHKVNKILKKICNLKFSSHKELIKMQMQETLKLLAT